MNCIKDWSQSSDYIDDAVDNAETDVYKIHNQNEYEEIIE